MNIILSRPYLSSLISLFLLYLIGFAVFMTNLAQQPLRPIEKDVDAIVVFTGSSGRIETGFDYLKNFSGPLLISGVHPSVDLTQLNGADLLKKAQYQRITLDYTARTTRENVTVTANWAKENNFNKVGIITASFHMPRSMMLFKQQVPNLNVSPYPSNVIDPPFTLILREYNKLLAASVRLL